MIYDEILREYDEEYMPVIGLHNPIGEAAYEKFYSTHINLREFIRISCLKYARSVLPPKDGESKYILSDTGDMIRVGYNACRDEILSRIQADEESSKPKKT